MALTESYHPVYEELDPESLAKVGEFASSLMQARVDQNNVQISRLVKEAMDDLKGDAESVDLLFGTLSYAEKFGSALEKVAVAELLPYVREAIKEIDTEHTLHKTASDWRSNASLGIGLGGLALGAAPYLSHVHRRNQRNSKIKSSLKAVLQDHPELRNNPNANRYFQAIVDFAPDVAANSLVAGNVMKTMHQIGPSAVTPRMISELLQVQRGQDDRPTGATYAGELGKQVGTLAKTVGGKK